jgi:putative peptide zinc metalloprotease protein
VYRLSGGLVRLRPGRVELQQRARVATVKTPVAGSRVIATVSTKGGVGKTTTTVNLGHTFASLHGDRVVALDGNPDAGSLGFRIRSETAATAATLLDEIDTVARYADMRAYTSQAASRLEVVAAPADPRVSTALGEADYRRLLDLLEAHYQLILVDCGTGILDDATRGIVEHADQLVVVTAPSVDAARATSYLLDWLDSHGHHHLVAQAVTVINGCRTDTGLVDLDEIEGHFAARCRTVVRVPWDAHLAAGASTGLDALTTATRDAYVEVAAAVAHGFTETDTNMEEAS